MLSWVRQWCWRGWWRQGIKVMTIVVVASSFFRQQISELFLQVLSGNWQGRGCWKVDHNVVMFCRSSWAMEELHQAFRQSMEERRRHLLIVMLQDVQPSSMPAMLKTCCKTFTYLEASDTLFWDRWVRHRQAKMLWFQFYYQPERRHFVIFYLHELVAQREQTDHQVLYPANCCEW